MVGGIGCDRHRPLPRASRRQYQAGLSGALAGAIVLNLRGTIHAGARFVAAEFIGYPLSRCMFQNVFQKSSARGIDHDQERICQENSR